MKRLSTMFSLLALLALAPDASAQQPVPVVAIGRWDVAGQLALLNRNKADIGSRWDHWYEAPLVQGSAGHYWTPHLKTELEITVSGAGTIGVEQDLRYREHRLRESTISATAVYQFFDNQWVHPFVGAGLEIARERDVAESLPAPIDRFAAPSLPLTLRPVPAIDKVSYSVRPVVAGGFKFYVSQRAFVEPRFAPRFQPTGRLPFNGEGASASISEEVCDGEIRVACGCVHPDDGRGA